MREITAMFAGSACAVQMFEVALSLRICCSRVCSASLYAWFPSASLQGRLLVEYKTKTYLLTPTIRPGINRANEFRASVFATDMKAGCGPP